MARDTLTARQERFAQLVVIHGTKQRIAYRKAYNAEGMKDGQVDAEAYKLTRHPKVAARIEALRSMAEGKLEKTVQDIGRQMVRIAYFDLRDCYDDEGSPLLPHELPEHVATVITGYEVVPGKLGRRVKVTIDRGKGVEMVARWRKMFVERVEHGGPGDFAHMSDEEFEKAYAAEKEAVAAIERARSRKKVTVKAVKQAKV